MDFLIIELLWQTLSFQTAHFINLGFLPPDIALIFNFHFHLFKNIRIQIRPGGIHRGQAGVIHLGPLEKLQQADPRFHRGCFT